MNILSLFDGCGMTYQALKNLGIQVDNYYASEIDKYAIQIAMKNHPDIKQIGDVTKVNADNLPKIDLLVGGSPCQGFSFAGKQLNFNDPRSSLFFEYVRLKNELKPKYFLLENVRMKKEYQDVISNLLGVQPIMINSALVSAQNRVRLYWTNLPVEQPEDLGILLKDVLESGDVDTRYYLTEKNLKHVSRDFGSKAKPQDVNEKSNTLTAAMGSGGGNVPYFNCKQIGEANLKGHDSIKRVYSPEGKSPTLTTMGGGHREPKVSTDNKTWRKLTPIECERLQTLDDGYTEGVSNTQRYKMLGNGFTVKVIEHILKGIG